MKKCKHCDIEIIKGRICTVCKNGLDRYKLTRLQMLELHAIQNGKCKICKNNIEMFAGRNGGFVDHDHKTSEIRGILCHLCNTIIGYIENKDIDVLVIKEYITSSNDKTLTFADPSAQRVRTKKPSPTTGSR